MTGIRVRDPQRIDKSSCRLVRFGRYVRSALLLYALVLIPERLPNAVTVDAREAARTIEKRQSHRNFLNHLHSGFTWTQFAPFVFKRTMSIGGPTYSGLWSISS